MAFEVFQLLDGKMFWRIFHSSFQHLFSFALLGGGRQESVALYVYIVFGAGAAAEESFDTF
jgi:hypothetical protein